MKNVVMQSIKYLINHRADDRKVWLENYNKDSVLNTEQKQITYEDFVDKEMKHFSKYDCDSSIPNMVDGWKISTRKILFSCFKRNLVNEIKGSTIGRLY